VINAVWQNRASRKQGDLSVQVPNLPPYLDSINDSIPLFGGHAILWGISGAEFASFIDLQETIQRASFRGI
jgi:hypothetical protein